MVTAGIESEPRMCSNGNFLGLSAESLQTTPVQRLRISDVHSYFILLGTRPQTHPGRKAWKGSWLVDIPSIHIIITNQLIYLLQVDVKMAD